MAGGHNNEPNFTKNEGTEFLEKKLKEAYEAYDNGLTWTIFEKIFNIVDDYWDQLKNNTAYKQLNFEKADKISEDNALLKDFSDIEKMILLSEQYETITVGSEIRSEYRYNVITTSEFQNQGLVDDGQLSADNFLRNRDKAFTQTWESSIPENKSYNFNNGIDSENGKESYVTLNVQTTNEKQNSWFKNTQEFPDYTKMYDFMYTQDTQPNDPDKKVNQENFQKNINFYPICVRRFAYRNQGIKPTFTNLNQDPINYPNSNIYIIKGIGEISHLYFFPSIEYIKYVKGSTATQQDTFDKSLLTKSFNYDKLVKDLKSRYENVIKNSGNITIEGNEYDGVYYNTSTRTYGKYICSMNQIYDPFAKPVIPPTDKSSTSPPLLTEAELEERRRNLRTVTTYREATAVSDPAQPVIKTPIPIGDQFQLDPKNNIMLLEYNNRHSKNKKSQLDSKVLDWYLDTFGYYNKNTGVNDRKVKPLRRGNIFDNKKNRKEIIKSIIDNILNEYEKNNLFKSIEDATDMKIGTGKDYYKILENNTIKIKSKEDRLLPTGRNNEVYEVQDYISVNSTPENLFWPFILDKLNSDPDFARKIYEFLRADNIRFADFESLAFYQKILKPEIYNKLTSGFSKSNNVTIPSIDFITGEGYKQSADYDVNNIIADIKRNITSYTVGNVSYANSAAAELGQSSEDFDKALDIITASNKGTQLEIKQTQQKLYSNIQELEYNIISNIFGKLVANRTKLNIETVENINYIGLLQKDIDRIGLNIDLHKNFYYTKIINDRQYYDIINHNWVKGVVYEYTQWVATKLQEWGAWGEFIGLSLQVIGTLLPAIVAILFRSPQFSAPAAGIGTKLVLVGELVQNASIISYIAGATINLVNNIINTNITFGELTIGVMDVVIFGFLMRGQFLKGKYFEPFAKKFQSILSKYSFSGYVEHGLSHKFFGEAAAHHAIAGKVTVGIFPYIVVYLNKELTSGNVLKSLAVSAVTTGVYAAEKNVFKAAKDAVKDDSTKENEIFMTNFIRAQGIEKGSSLDLFMTHFDEIRKLPEYQNLVKTIIETPNDAVNANSNPTSFNYPSNISNNPDKAYNLQKDHPFSFMVQELFKNLTGNKNIDLKQITKDFYNFHNDFIKPMDELKFNLTEEQKRILSNINEFKRRYPSLVMKLD